jgi:hypothetical protein
LYPEKGYKVHKQPVVAISDCDIFSEQTLEKASDWIPYWTGKILKEKKNKKVWRK